MNPQIVRDASISSSFPMECGPQDLSFLMTTISVLYTDGYPMTRPRLGKSRNLSFSAEERKPGASLSTSFATLTTTTLAEPSPTDRTISHRILLYSIFRRIGSTIFSFSQSEVLCIGGKRSYIIIVRFVSAT